ncbi:hypothetical protein Scep_016556 [Stephania cephalantha]|uniref:Uncharacterized protein n=1 Tax=Stephania cephalantha TaxID=152367 RepID=A0AAP0NTC8_9MAGN
MRRGFSQLRRADVPNRLGGEGGSDPWRETPRREEEGGDGVAIFDQAAAVHTRASGDGGEEVRRGHRSKERRRTAAAAAVVRGGICVAVVRGGRTAPKGKRRRDLGGAMRGRRGAEAATIYTENPAVEWKEEVIKSLDYDDDDGQCSDGLSGEYNAAMKKQRPRTSRTAGGGGGGQIGESIW